MPQTASTTVVNRSDRIRAAAASIALAYLRNLAENDYLRASVVLAEFQRFWNDQRTIIPATGSAGVPGVLPVTGTFDAASQTQRALFYVLVLQAVVPGSSTATAQVGVAAMASWYRQHVRLPESARLWGAYRASRGVPSQDAGLSVADWAFEFIDIGSHQNDLMDILANGQTTVPVPTNTSPPPINTHTAYGEMPPISVSAMAPRSQAWTGWPWVVAGGAAALLFGGLVYKRKGRRR